MPIPNNDATINSNIQRAINSPGPSISTPSHLAQYLLYAAQLADALNSGNAFHQGLHEMDPVMQPFSHGGAPTMALGFGLTDLARNALLRHASQGTQNTAAATQAALNALGILQTNHNLQKAQAPVPQAAPITSPQPQGGPKVP